LSDTELFDTPIIVAGAAHVSVIKEQLGGRPARIIVEPAARNTAPAIALAAHLVDDAPMLVCPSDHHIANTAAFHAAVRVGLTGVEAGQMMTFGIAAAYLERGAPLLDSVFKVARFEEKPESARAQAFVASGRHSWNGGLFLLGSARFLDELALLRPEMAAACAEAMKKAEIYGACIHPHAEIFTAINGESIDYAVMENSDKVAMLEADMGWSDIGSFASLAKHLQRDAKGNATKGRVDVLESRNVTVFAGPMRVSIAGMDDIIVAVDGNDIMITCAPLAQIVGKLPGAMGN
jgi:mannose-1-phosphate guanylyltransferase/mannose-6-phosphate isomerase